MKSKWLITKFFDGDIFSVDNDNKHFIWSLRRTNNWPILIKRSRWQFNDAEIWPDRETVETECKTVPKLLLAEAVKTDIIVIVDVDVVANNFMSSNDNQFRNATRCNKKGNNIRSLNVPPSCTSLWPGTDPIEKISRVNLRSAHFEHSDWLFRISQKSQSVNSKPV